ncbi:ABC transporter ATP-binding protein [Candidatus Parvarchaeota archaeon]|nr:ABC transporter ATP-binding protein [Candidatus Parvarchaeota archaeon]
MEPYIAINRASKRFKATTAINKITVSFYPGLSIILGPNGAGKSTLLRCIMGLYRIDSGKIRVFGRDPYKDDASRQRMSLLSDNYSLYDYLSVSDNLRFFGRLYGIKDEDTEEIARKTLKEMDALRFLDAKVYSLSRGTKQKIAFCRSILNRPKALLLDEPTAFLDASSSEYVREFMKTYSREGNSVLFVTQKLDEVTRFNSRLIILDKGAMADDTKTYLLYKKIGGDATILIRFARPMRIEKLRKEGLEIVGADEEYSSSIRVKIKDYREINSTLRRLMSSGADIVNVDYLEPILEKMSKD